MGEPFNRQVSPKQMSAPMHMNIYSILTIPFFDVFFVFAVRFIVKNQIVWWSCCCCCFCCLLEMCAVRLWALPISHEVDTIFFLRRNEQTSFCPHKSDVNFFPSLGKQRAKKNTFNIHARETATRLNRLRRKKKKRSSRFWRLRLNFTTFDRFTIKRQFRANFMLFAIALCWLVGDRHNSFQWISSKALIQIKLKYRLFADKRK